MHKSDSHFCALLMVSAGADGAALQEKALVKELSRRLTEDYGKGFTERNLWSMRKFYLAFPKVNALRSELTWTHYRLLSLQPAGKLAVEDEMKNIVAPLQTDKLEFIKNPVVAEFLGLEPNADFQESRLESVERASSDSGLASR